MMILMTLKIVSELRLELNDLKGRQWVYSGVKAIERSGNRGERRVRTAEKAVPQSVADRAFKKVLEENMSGCESPLRF